MKKEEVVNLVNKVKTNRDELKLKMHLASMDAKQEFEKAEEKLEYVKTKVSQIKDEAIDASDEYIAKVKIISEELKETYYRIAKRLSE